ncbi:hypothetical protein DFQ27_000678, partial [Actinomortierella ambigua]
CGHIASQSIGCHRKSTEADFIHVFRAVFALASLGMEGLITFGGEKMLQASKVQIEAQKNRYGTCGPDASMSDAGKRGDLIVAFQDPDRETPYTELCNRETPYIELCDIEGKASSQNPTQVAIQHRKNLLHIRCAQEYILTLLPPGYEDKLSLLSGDLIGRAVFFYQMGMVEGEWVAEFVAKTPDGSAIPCNLPSHISDLEAFVNDGSL